MKRRISIRLSAEVRGEIDRITPESCSRSAFIEKVLSDHVRKMALPDTSAKDVVRIGAAEARLSGEVEDAVDHQP
jgi:hypothetical protein